MLSRGDRSKVRLPNGAGAVSLSLPTEPEKKFSAPIQLSLFEVPIICVCVCATRECEWASLTSRL